MIKIHPAESWESRMFIATAAREANGDWTLAGMRPTSGGYYEHTADELRYKDGSGRSQPID